MNENCACTFHIKSVVNNANNNNNELVALFHLDFMLKIFYFIIRCIFTQNIIKIIFNTKRKLRYLPLYKNRYLSLYFSIYIYAERMYLYICSINVMQCIYVGYLN